MDYYENQKFMDQINDIERWQETNMPRLKELTSEMEECCKSKYIDVLFEFDHALFVLSDSCLLRTLTEDKVANFKDSFERLLSFCRFVKVPEPISVWTWYVNWVEALSKDEQHHHDVDDWDHFDDGYVPF